jgi:hypothetical protein
MKVKIRFFALVLLAANFGPSNTMGASPDVLYEQRNIQPMEDTAGERSAIGRLASALSSGRAAMGDFHGPRIENNSYKSALNPPLAGLECSIDRIASYISCYSAPIASEDEAVNRFTQVVDELQSALPSERWTGKSTPETASIRSYTYRDQNSGAHIDIDIIVQAGGPRAYVISAFAWPH